MKREIYELNPTACKQCGNIIPYKKGVEYKIFCNIKCSSLHSQKEENSSVCLACNAPILSKYRKQTYCNNECQAKHSSMKAIEKWKNGEVPGYTGKQKLLKRSIRKYLFETRGTACSICGWDERHPDDDSILTEIDHIDGNAENCSEENLRILCPNCHSKTSTHRARNKNGTRSTRYN